MATAVRDATRRERGARGSLRRRLSEIWLAPVLLKGEKK